jgi:hypothetical protein
LAKRCKGGHIIHDQAVTLAHGGSDTGHAASQERVDGAFGLKRHRQSGQRLAAQTRATRQVVLQRQVAGFDSQRKLQVGQGVIVGAANPRGTWQGGQAVKRVQHLGRRAFKQTPAPARKQRIATKKQWVLARGLRPKGDVTQGMAWHLVNLKLQAMPVKAVTLLQALGGYRHLFVDGAQYTGPGAGHQFGQATGVIGTVVRD